MVSDFAVLCIAGFVTFLPVNMTRGSRAGGGAVVVPLVWAERAGHEPRLAGSSVSVAVAVLAPTSIYGAATSIGASDVGRVFLVVVFCVEWGLEAGLSPPAHAGVVQVSAGQVVVFVEGP